MKLLVGLGNPGREYEATRHNAGFWWVENLADAQRVPQAESSSSAASGACSGSNDAGCCCRRRS
jgi:PTH1 family peptidyl-tRNA hydrolase